MLTIPNGMLDIIPVEFSAASHTEAVLAALGEQLAAQNAHIELVAIGGAAS